jgi:drug/metabolite transporter (DMT)-like permease
MSVLFALLAGLTNGSTALFQRVANVSAPKEIANWRQHARYLIARPLWLMGLACLILTFVFTAIALYFGQLAVVQPLYVTELVFTLALRRLWLRDVIPTRSWAAAGVLGAGLAAFLLIARPAPGNRHTTAPEWLGVLVVGAVVLGVLMLGARRGSPTRRAALYGAAAGLVWSVDAGVVKAATQVLQRDGWAGLFEHWPVYVLVVSGMLGTLLVQGALNVGPLQASQPAMLIVEPLAGILVGVALFGERLTNSPIAIVGQCLSLALMALGVVLVSQWAPPPIAERPQGSKNSGSDEAEKVTENGH